MLKITLKLILIISLFTVTAFAEGDMTNGDRDGGGLVCAECVTTQVDTKFDSDKSVNYDDSIIEFINKFFIKLIG